MPSDQPSLVDLHRLAIQAAKKQEWSAAITFNQQILQQEPEQTAAKLRLGVAYVHTKQPKLAKAALKEVIAQDPTNQLAQRHLQSMEQGRAIEAVQAQASDFIEEPGKTKITELHRLASKQVLESLRPGDSCELKIKNRFISIECNGKYVGSLADDLSSRLCKLLKTGNTYQCRIYASNSTHCSVFLKEITRSATNVAMPSFPVSIQSAGQEEWLFMDESEMSLEDAPPPEYLDTEESDGAVEPRIELTIPTEEESRTHEESSPRDRDHSDES